MMNYDSIYLAQDRKWLGNWRLVTMEVLCLQWSIISERPRGQLAAYLVVNQGAMLARKFYMFVCILCDILRLEMPMYLMHCLTQGVCKIRYGTKVVSSHVKHKLHFK